MRVERGVGKGAIRRSQSAPHMHVLLCICSNVVAVLLQWPEPHNCYNTHVPEYVYTSAAETLFCQPHWIEIEQYSSTGWAHHCHRGRVEAGKGGGAGETLVVLWHGISLLRQSQPMSMSVRHRQHERPRLAKYNDTPVKGHLAARPLLMGGGGVRATPSPGLWLGAGASPARQPTPWDWAPPLGPLGRTQHHP